MTDLAMWIVTGGSTLAIFAGIAWFLAPYAKRLRQSFADAIEDGYDGPRPDLVLAGQQARTPQPVDDAVDEPGTPEPGYPVPADDVAWCEECDPTSAHTSHPVDDCESWVPDYDLRDYWPEPPLRLVETPVAYFSKAVVGGLAALVVMFAAALRDSQVTLHEATFAGLAWAFVTAVVYMTPQRDRKQEPPYTDPVNWIDRR